MSKGQSPEVMNFSARIMMARIRELLGERARHDKKQGSPPPSWADIYKKRVEEALARPNAHKPIQYEFGQGFEAFWQSKEGDRWRLERRKEILSRYDRTLRGRIYRWLAGPYLKSLDTLVPKSQVPFSLRKHMPDYRSDIEETPRPQGVS